MLTDEHIIEIRDECLPSQGEKFDTLAYARAIESAVRAELVAASPLTDEQCDEFRRLPGTFNDMVRAIYEAGRASKAAEYADVPPDKFKALYWASSSSFYLPSSELNKALVAIDNGTYNPKIGGEE